MYTSSETQGQSVGPGEKARRKFSSTDGKAPGYWLSPDHFQTVEQMLAPNWAQKMLCIIVPNRRTVSPEFFSWVRTRRLLPQNDVGHLSHCNSVEVTRVKERSAVVTTRLTLPQQFMGAKKPNYLILPDLPRLHQHSSPGDIHRSSLEINDHTYMQLSFNNRLQLVRTLLNAQILTGFHMLTPVGK